MVRKTTFKTLAVDHYYPGFVCVGICVELRIFIYAPIPAWCIGKGEFIVKTW